ncbi:MAG: Protein translocase subunit SecA [Eubacteriales bacterium SKADARSKE-1]|nr:Protein translocase subunit SecA [Eubacteriales bacterium SKADARSKE-1]
MNFLKTLFGNYSKREVKRVKPLCDAVLALEETYRNMSDKELKSQTGILREKLKNGATTDDILVEAFATCREAATRVLGLTHFPCQIIGGIILHQGRISEMKTGEGKTLVETLPAYLNALSGKGVHIVTVNDYLAKRDSELMGKVYRFLGLSLGLLSHDMDNNERQKAYAADITYCTNNELGFDYLRDNMVTYKENRVQRGHHFAIVDEVDSILIDEARTPLIISGQGDKSTELYTIADKFAKSLKMVKVAEINEKEDADEAYEGADYIVDEKAKTATLTQEGVKKAEEFFNVDNLMDIENTTLQHHINQAIKARGVMQNEIDYVVKDGEVVIVDEFTGRLMFGRRYNEGLHQAIEAKEGVKVARESKTLAAITFQNYFKLYEKLSGMTGTAMTEEDEFREIYKLDVVELPTNKPVIRIDHHDAVFKTENGKYIAAIKDLIEYHQKGQPVLIGTISIDKSEHLSSLLKKQGIKHTVLNAKYHEKEAEIIAQAGKKGAVTIATNMAGRGTDIKLGGNSEYLATSEMRSMGYSEDIINEASGFADTDDQEILEARKIFSDLIKKHNAEIKDEVKEVKELGGLVIMGTERAETRRIDNQLRGRSGRQGDPGETRFYLSLEDDLMRLFGGERMKSIMDHLNVEEDMPIDSPMISRTIESSQRKVEGRDFGIRKSVFQYDNVMDRQREVIYDQRNKVLDGDDLSEQIIKMIVQSVEKTVERYLPGHEDKERWNIEGLRDYYLGWLLTADDLKFEKEDLKKITIKDIIEDIKEKALNLYAAREKEFGKEILREIERVVLLKNVDNHWMDHIDAMEELKKGIKLRAYAQRDPVIEYRTEGFDMFDEMIDNIRDDTVKVLLTFKMSNPNETPKRHGVVDEGPVKPNLNSSSTTNKTVKNKEKVGRNDLCPCGSGKKYKKCCGANEN